MKNYFWIRLSLQIVAVFGVIIALSFIPDKYPTFFGDNYCTIHHNQFSELYHDAPTWHWGYRHFIWCFMGIVLFIVQTIRIVIFIYNSTKQAV